MSGLFTIASFLFGLVVGSFLNVCIYRIPHKQSIVKPASHCTKCGDPIRARDNIPVLSYLLLRGKCRSCGTRISLQYPVVELVTGLSFLAMFVKFGWSLELAGALFFVSILILVSVVDLGHKIIPNRVILPAIVVAVAFLGVKLISNVDFLPLVGPTSAFFPLLGLLMGGGTLMLFAMIRADWIGGGDIKLNAFMGLFLGAYVLISLLVASIVGSLVSLLLIAFKKLNRKDTIPFGPFLAVGAIVTLFFGPSLLSLYLSTL